MCRLLELDVESELEFKVVRDDELKLLADGGISSQFEPSGGNAMDSVIQGEAEPSPFI